MKLIRLLVIVVLGMSQSYAQEPGKNPENNPTPSQLSVDSDKFIIGPEDILTILVWKEEALSKTVSVRSDGKISMPLIDEIKAAGLTPLQLKEMLTQRLKDFVESPVVTVIVQQSKNKSLTNNYNVYVSGQVHKPGVYNLAGEVSLLQLIAQVGGFTDWADQKKILLIRKEGDKENRFYVNYKKMVKGEAPKCILKSDDIIVVND